jgi:hypothetical protein
MKTYVVVWWDFLRQRWCLEVVYAPTASKARHEVWREYASGMRIAEKTWMNLRNCQAFLVSQKEEPVEVVR